MAAGSTKSLAKDAAKHRRKTGRGGEDFQRFPMRLHHQSDSGDNPRPSPPTQHAVEWLEILLLFL